VPSQFRRPASVEARGERNGAEGVRVIFRRMYLFVQSAFIVVADHKPGVAERRR
jgi:hypothetical protein